LSKIIYICNEVLNCAQKEGESLGAAWSRHNQLSLSGPELSIPKDLQIKALLISVDEPIITYLDTSDISALPAREELLQLTASGIGLENEIEDPTPFPLSIKEDCFDNNIGNSSKAPNSDLKGLKFEPVGQDLEEFIASKKNLLELSTIISRNWSIVVEVDGSYIRIYPGTKTICCCLQGYSFQMVRYDPRVVLNILLLDEASGIDMQPLIPLTKILQWQPGQNNRRE
jgi:hypothetical protein